MPTLQVSLLLLLLAILSQLCLREISEFSS
jgi:hypothetical protein